MEQWTLFYEEKDIALVILDVMMPKMDGWQVCREIRTTLAGSDHHADGKKSDERDELQGFELGVDEYISKPFSPKILVARVGSDSAHGPQSWLRMICFTAGGIEIDKAAHMVKIDGKPIELSYKEFELLTYFVENQGIALSQRRF